MLAVRRFIKLHPETQSMLEAITGQDLNGDGVIAPDVSHADVESTAVELDYVDESARWSRRTNNVSGLALSVTFGDSSPKGRASGLPEDFCLSLWERWMRPAGADGEGKDADRRLTLC